MATAHIVSCAAWSKVLLGGMQSLRVLVIEDDALIALMLAEVLRDMGHLVCATARTPAEAIAAARQENPDLVLSDVKLRDGSGIDAVEEIRPQQAGPTYVHDRRPGGPEIALPAAVAIRKPFSQDSLAKAIEKASAAAAPP